MELASDEKDFRFTSHSPTWDDAEPELKKQRLGGKSDGIGSGSNSNGSSGDSNNNGSGVTNVFIGNNQDDVYFEEYKYMLLSRLCSGLSTLDRA
ncbi:unnamed protein product [Cuscuta campestris]|uniref:Uncharacterized protein n=1 Tax=Cuscuta campestris TaxID=132261 RepID=A0A484NEL6_9ASTE|nr:unnamed protein product [Cuscuta campestris]